MAVDWTSLLNEHGRALLLYARQWCSCYEDAEEAMQNGFVRFWKSQYRTVSNPLPLLYTAVKRSAIDLGRSKTRRTIREQKVADETPMEEWFENGLETDEQRKQIQQAMDQLPPEQREVIVMKIWGDLTFKEIAESLEISINTAASRYRYALSALRGRLEGLPV